MNVTDEFSDNLPGNFHLSSIDYTIFAVMLTISSAIGIYFGYFDGQEKTAEEYLLGGKNMKVIPIAISLVASEISCFAMVSVPSEIYSYGIHMILQIPALFVVLLFINYVTIPVLYNNNINNCYEYLELRFNKTVRQLVTGTFLSTMILVLPMFAYIPSLAFSQVSGQNVHLINAIVTTVCVAYTMIGGIKAVVWTDVVQASIMLLSIVLVLVYAVPKVGTISNVIDIAVEGKRIAPFNMSLDFTSRQSFWCMFIGLIVMWSSHIGCSQSHVQRIVSLPTISQARKAMVLNAIGVAIFYILNIFTGITMYAYYHNCDPRKAGNVKKIDKIMPYFVQEIVGHLNGMPGLFLSSLFSASLSSLSAFMNTLSGIIYFDYIAKCSKTTTEMKARFYLKMVVALMGAYVIAMGYAMEQFSSMFQFANTLAGITNGAIVGVFFLAFFYPRANAKVALVAFIGSIVVIGWIAIGAMVKHTQSYESLPTSIEGCVPPNSTVEVSHHTREAISNNPTTTKGNNNDDIFAIYKLSFFWYAPIGLAITILSGIISSIFMVDKTLMEKMNPSLVSKAAQFLIPKQYRQIPVNNGGRNLVNLQNRRREMAK